MDRNKVLDRDEYFIYRNTGIVEPLTDPSYDIEINLRKEIQNGTFGDEDNPANRHKLFIWVWERKQHICEETGTYLGPDMQAEFMSHILSRGAHIEMWNDPRNINILSPDSHRHWETGKREKMKIWNKNKEVIAILKADYSKLKTYTAFPEKPETQNSFICPHCGVKINTKTINDKH